MMKRIGHVDSMGDLRKAKTIIVGKPERKTPLERNMSG
jgi:hypothetical protein